MSIILEKIVVYFEALLASVLVPLPTILLLHYCGESVKSSKLFHTVILLWLICFFALSIGQFTNWFYVVTPNNEFIRTSLLPLPMLPLVLGMFVNIVGLIRRRKNCQPGIWSLS